MLYERFWKWLILDKRRNCEHDWEENGYSHTHIGYGEALKRLHFKCKNCGKKEKRHDSDAGTFIYF